MSSPSDSESNQLEKRLENTELQVRRLKIAVWIMGIVLLAILIPPVGAILGLSLMILVIVSAVLLFISCVIWVLERMSQRGDNASRSD